jgi:hypothetical protein
MKKIIVAIPHSHTWFWTQTCIASLLRNPPKADGCEVEIVVVDNSPWSPAIRGLADTQRSEENPNLWGTHEPVTVTIAQNYKGNKFHASALDCIVETMDFDYLMALETDVLALRPEWLRWLMWQMKDTDFAVGHWHHENFINPSCTLYRGDVLRAMQTWCKENKEPDVLRWGPDFSCADPLDKNMPNWATHEIETMRDWIAGPFAEKRGFPPGTVLKETPSGQIKGPGWYEPGQMLHHWATNEGYTYTVCPTLTTKRADGMPLQTLYGSSMPDPGRQLEAVELFGNAETAHMWGGTRALDILKHEVTCNFVGTNTPFWLEREARFWKAIVPVDVQAQTLELIRKYGWHYKGAGTPEVTDRDRAAVAMVQECYARGGVVI